MRTPSGGCGVCSSIGCNIVRMVVRASSFFVLAFRLPLILLSSLLAIISPDESLGGPSHLAYLDVALMLPSFFMLSPVARAADREADPELAAACRRPSSSPSASPSLTPEGERSRANEREESGAREGSHDGVAPVAGTPGTGCAAATPAAVASAACCDAVLSNDSDFLVVDIPG